MDIFFSLKKYVLSQKKGLPKRGGFSAFPSKLFFLKKWSQNHIFTHCRSSRREVFCKKGALRNLAKLAESLIEKEALAQMFSCEFCQIS